MRDSGIQHGLVLVNPMHITAAVYVNDDESGLIADIDDWLERLAPHEPVVAVPPQPRRGQRRRAPEAAADGAPGRAADHRRHASTSGPWEQVFYAEFDGRRRKRVVLKAIGD